MTNNIDTERPRYVTCMLQEAELFHSKFFLNFYFPLHVYVTYYRSYDFYFFVKLISKLHYCDAILSHLFTIKKNEGIMQLSLELEKNYYC